MMPTMNNSKRKKYDNVKKNILYHREIIISPKPLMNISINSELLHRNKFFYHNQNSSDDESFYKSIQPILVVAQVFGILPVSNVLYKNPTKMSFNYLSLRSLHVIIIVTLISIRICTAIIRIVKTLTIIPENLTDVLSTQITFAIFYTNGLCCILFFYWLSPKWITLQQNWNTMEKQLDNFDGVRTLLKWKLSAVSLIVMFLAIVEHILWFCVKISKTTIVEHFRTLGRDFIAVWNSETEILESLNICFTVGICLNINNIITTFAWNFADVFIILVSIGLAEKYKSLNESVMQLVTSNKAYTVNWIKFRKKYTLLRNLVMQTDDDISPLILLSFTNNLYFICLQLFNGLRIKRNDALEKIYYFASFGFLVCRICCVTLFASRIPEQCKNSLTAIYSSPTSYFTIETDRLIHLLATDDVALSGMKFFSITRNFMLAIAGAIATYEVVLLQFHSSGKA